MWYKGVSATLEEALELGKVAESGRVAFRRASWRRQLKRRSEEGIQGRAKTRNKDLEVGEFLLLLGN